MEQYINVGAQSREVQNLENAVLKVFNSLYPNPLLNNPYISVGNAFSGTNDLIVPHKLNRVPKGYIVIGRNANAMIYTSSTTNTAPKAYMILKASGTVTADILFF